MGQNARNQARMCLLGLNYSILTFYPINPKNIKFCPQNSNFKPKWWNMKVQIYQKLLNQWTWKFDTMLRTWNGVLRCNMMTSQQIQYGGRPPYWKSSLGYIYVIYCPINAKFCEEAESRSDTGRVTKIPILKIQDGGRPSFWKWFYRYISAGNHSINVQYSVQYFDEIWCADSY